MSLLPAITALQVAVSPAPALPMPRASDCGAKTIVLMASWRINDSAERQCGKGALPCRLPKGGARGFRAPW
jgi:hypothetical protein